MRCYIKNITYPTYGYWQVDSKKLFLRWVPKSQASLIDFDIAVHRLRGLPPKNLGIELVDGTVIPATMFLD